MSLEIVFWDVEHGSSTYIKTPNGKHIVCDLGVGSYESNDETFSPLLHLKNKYNVKQLDLVIITHPHKDHIDDIMNFEQLYPKVLWCPRQLTREDVMKDIREEDKPLFDKYFELRDKYSYPLASENDPSKSGNLGGVTLQSFFPTDCDKANINNYSIVTVLTYAQSKVIITGDNELPSWNELLAQGNFATAVKNADILLAPHHGRDSGFCKDLFEHFSPYLTIISDGRFCDTSATGRYYNLTKGWNVHYRNGSTEERKCLTTRSDGYIVVKLGYTPDQKPFIYVTAKGA